MARRTVRVAGARKRTMIWLTAGINNIVLTSASTLLGVLNAGGLALRPFTIVRTHLVLRFTSDQAGAGERAQGVFTMQVVKETASAAGIASVPTGVLEPNADFFVFQPLFQNFGFISGSGAAQIQGQGNHWTLDSKAMRKVGIDDDVVQVFDFRSFIGSEIAAEGRFLVKLH